LLSWHARLDYTTAAVKSSEPQTLGRYKLLALLATGGMAEIYLARQTGIQGFERLVVVKKILPQLAKEQRFLDMFFDEARIAAQLNHPNIVQIYDLGKEDETYFIAMEYLEGESLGYLIREANRAGHDLPPALAAGMIAQVCDGLDFAHNLHDDSGRPLSIIHRDISPQNIIVLFSGGVKLVDFGIAKAASQVHQTRVGTLKGKLAYLAPEQIQGKPVDARSDIFSLGVVFWELLTCRRLFKADNEASILQTIVFGEVAPPRRFNPAVSPELEAIVLQALEKDPDRRPPTAGRMAAAIREHLLKAGAAAGVQEVAAFVDLVFSDRARTKRRLLEEIRRSDGKHISLEVLKPETGESLPSGPDELEDRLPPEKLAEAPTRAVRRPDSRELEMPLSRPRASRLPLVLGLLLPLLLGGILVGWWLAGKNPKDPPIDALSPGGGAPPDAFSGVQDAGGSALSASDSGLPLDGGPVPVASADAGLVAGGPFDAGSDGAKDLAAGPGPRPIKTTPPRAPPGSLRLDTKPWSEVFLGSRSLGITPLMGVKLPAGRHKLTLVNREQNLKKVLPVIIEPGKTTTLFQKLAD
jgi:serine/threonine-protein kinase